MVCINLKVIKKKFQTETLLEEKRLYSFIFYLDKIKLQLENIKLILLGKIIVRKGKEYLLWLSCLINIWMIGDFW
jgi:hypothetical protein